jgi:menaquinone-dependent protoporphyrinogen IX oxidase
MPNKFLVTYASRTGSTAAIAQAIGTTLAEGGTQLERGSRVGGKYSSDVERLAKTWKVFA